MDKKLLRKIAMTYGLYMGIVSIVVAVIQYVSGMYDLSGQGSMRWVSMLIGLAITVVFVIMAINKYKQEGDGFLNFGEGFRLSFSTIIFSILISLVWLVLYMFVLEPNYQDQIIEASYERFEAQGIDPDSPQAEMGLEWTEKMTTPLFMLLWTIVNGAIFGAVLSLIFAAFMKNNRPEFMQSEGAALDNESE